MYKMISMLAGMILGGLITRYFFFDTIDEISWFGYMRASFDFANQELGDFLLSSAIKTKLLIGVVVGGIVGLLIARD